MFEVSFCDNKYSFELIPNDDNRIMFKSECIDNASLDEPRQLNGDSELVSAIQEKNSFETPEYINNSVKTAPSKRLQGLISNYSKVRNAALLTKYMGIDVIIKSIANILIIGYK